jgi:hypothetical protein
MSAELSRHYEAIILLFLRGKISREERNARIIALRDHPSTEGMSFEQRDALAKAALERVIDILDEVHFKGGGAKWQ